MNLDALVPKLPRGEDHSQAKLTADQVVEMRRLHATGIGYLRLARAFKISPAHVQRIVRRRAWAHVN
jgi:DNA invertase Pin-like site-specific DNA recombinase